MPPYLSIPSPPGAPSRRCELDPQGPRTGFNRRLKSFSLQRQHLHWQKTLGKLLSGDLVLHKGTGKEAPTSSRPTIRPKKRRLTSANASFTSDGSGHVSITVRRASRAARPRDPWARHLTTAKRRSRSASWSGFWIGKGLPRFSTDCVMIGLYDTVSNG